MPTYHYRCSRCQQHLEVVQSMKDDPITECAACGGEMQKVLQPVGIVLKGSGFYRTDSRSGSGPKRSTEKTEKTEKTEETGKTETGKTDKTDKTGKSESKGDGKGGSSPSDSPSSATSSSSVAKGTKAKSA